MGNASMRHCLYAILKLSREMNIRRSDSTKEEDVFEGDGAWIKRWATV